MVVGRRPADLRRAAGQEHVAGSGEGVQERPHPRLAGRGALTLFFGGASHWESSAARRAVPGASGPDTAGRRISRRAAGGRSGEGLPQTADLVERLGARLVRAGHRGDETFPLLVESSV